MNGFNLVFAPDGSGRCLYTEAIDLRQLGPLQLRRATTIEFNESLQQWEVQDTGNELLFADPSRAACLQWEQSNLQP